MAAYDTAYHEFIDERKPPAHPKVLDTGKDNEPELQSGSTECKRKREDNQEEIIDLAWEKVYILWVKLEMAFRKQIRKRPTQTVYEITRLLHQRMTQMDDRHFFTGRIPSPMVYSVFLFWQTLGADWKEDSPCDKQYQEMSLALEHLRDILEATEVDEHPRKKR